jgi:thioredoxin reductase
VQHDVEGVFVEVGYTVNPQLVEHLAPLDARKQIIVDPATNSTSVPGLFAAGDITTILQKQIVISAGEGAKAALAVDAYLQSLGRKPRSGATDWGVSTPLHHQTLTQ